jgi:hypothetical protein
VTASLATLSSRDRDAVLNAVVAVEESVEPVAQAQLPGLADPALRELVGQSLRGAGRALVRVGEDAWISGYDDTVADRLAHEGTGVLAPIDAAVLTLVLLHAVAIPAARGTTDTTDWSSDDLPAPDVAALTANRDRRLNERAVRASLRRLRDAGVLRTGLRSKLLPGPQFRRLTDERSRMVWENMVVATAPGSNLARAIHRRRGAAST